MAFAARRDGTRPSQRLTGTTVTQGLGFIMVKGYSIPQIALHWGVALLILFQLVFGEAMGQAWRSVRQGATAAMTGMVWAHILVGIAVLALVVWRLWLRFSRGAPEAASGESKAVRLAGAVSHWALYGLMVAAPVTGLLAWYGGVTALAAVHVLAKPLFILLIGLHVIASLWHQFVRKDGVMARMVRPVE